MHVVLAAHRRIVAPQRIEGTFDFLAGGDVGFVMFDIDVRRGTVVLDHRVDGGGVLVDLCVGRADFRNGVLTITLPFREEARPRSINVEVSA